MKTLNGKVALITGGALGLGLETARQLGSLGATVLIAARDVNHAKGEALILARGGIKAQGVKLEMSEQDDITSLVQYLDQTYGRLDILINNAGIWLESASGSAMPDNTTSTASPETLREIFDINFFSLVELTQKLLPLIQNSEAGRIFNVSSILGSLSLHTDPQSMIFNSKAFAYNASKTGVSAFTIHLAHELSGTPIKVNFAHPGWVRSAIGGESAVMDLEEGSHTAVKLAMTDEDGPTGTFFHLTIRCRGSHDMREDDCPLLQ